MELCVAAVPAYALPRHGWCHIFVLLPRALLPAQAEAESLLLTLLVLLCALPTPTGTIGAGAGGQELSLRLSQPLSWVSPARQHHCFFPSSPHRCVWTWGRGARL